MEYFDPSCDEEPPSDLPEQVRRSWRRLKRQGLGRNRKLKPVEGGLATLQEPLVALFRRVGPRIRQAFGAPDDAIILLTDRFGNLSVFDGGEPILARLSKRGWDTGVCFNEQHAGTNAIDIALREREPMTTAPGSHTNTTFRDVEITAIPLFGDADEVIGSLAAIIEEEAEIPGLDRILTVSAVLFEDIMRSRDTNADLSRRLDEQRTIADAMKDGTMVVNREGIVENMNKAAAHILRIDPEKSIGRDLAELLGFEPIISPIFKTGEGYTDREVRIARGGDPIHLVDTATPIINAAGEVVSVVNTFREFGRVAQVAQKFAGNYARYTFDQIIGGSPAIRKAITMARRAAQGNSNVLFLGESGTGKELFAQGLHLASERAKGPFVAINCAALPKDLIETELFGYTAGSFTGADQEGRPGKFEIATGGTIFLDEISEMPVDVQVKLLRVLQEREITRLGSTETIRVDVRFVAAMNRNVTKLIEEGRFRQDLYYRINVLEIPVPALRHRDGDVELLARHYLVHYARILDKPIRGFAPYVLDSMKRYAWPGNVRELQNFVERMVNFADGDIAGENVSLPDTVTGSEKATRETGHLPTLEEAEKDLMLRALREAEYNVTQAARLIGMTKPRFYRKAEGYKIDLKRRGQP